MPVESRTLEYLLRCGYRPDQIAGFSEETRLFQDIGLYGDNARDELHRLETDFQVDLSKFPFRRYFPGEFGWHHFILTFLWRTPLAEDIRKRYPPITLHMIEQTLQHKNWIFD
jgi:hypothetical protein